LLTVVSEVLPFRQEAVGAISSRRSLTCGDENYVLSGRYTCSDGGKLEIEYGHYQNVGNLTNKISLTGFETL
jgi:hypothetical protein